MQGTRPDIALPISILSRFLAKPTQSLLKASTHTLRYIKGSLDTGLVYNRHDKKGLHAYTDADWGGSYLKNSDYKSTSGYVVFFAGGPISWASKRQQNTALSTTDAEYMAQGLLLRHISHLLNLLGEIHRPPPLPIQVYADNQSAQALARNPVFHTRSKHIPLTWHWQRQMINKGEVQFIHIPTKLQAADGFTKPLPQVDFYKFKRLLNLSN